MHPCLFPCTNRTDKYEKDKVEYWVEEETKGSYKLLHSEAWSDKRQIDATEDDGPAEGTDHENDDDDDGTDDSDGATSDSSDSSTSCAKKKRGKRSNAKKSKKDKKQKKSKKAKKKSKRNKSSPSSKTGSPKKAQLEEEVRAEAAPVGTQQSLTAYKPRLSRRSRTPARS